MRTYKDLIKIKTFDSRLEYLELNDRLFSNKHIGDRFDLQSFYKSSAWRRVRDAVIHRDKGCDLAIEGLPIFGSIYVHHINPINSRNMVMTPEEATNMNNLVCSSKRTHDLIHYGSQIHRDDGFLVRTPNDTRRW